MNNVSRRALLRAGAAGSALALAGCASIGASNKPKVVVIGGGYGGATAARYLRRWSNGDIDVTLVERNREFISCPISNLVLGGARQMSDITVGYDGLRANGVKVVHGEVTRVDTDKRAVHLASGATLPYDRLVVSPGIDIIYEEVPGLRAAEAEGRILTAWKAGPQTVALRKQLEAMRDGGVYAITVPLAPYRCPPGPYERASMVAHYFSKAKPKSKVLILDANPDVVSKGPLFKKAWSEMYGSMIEFRPNNALVDVDPRAMAAKLQLDDVKADVLNVVPPVRAGDIARATGLINANNRWCTVDWLTMESTAVKNVHVLGDSTLAGPLMPKSGHMSNQQAKVAAAAIINLFAGRPPNPTPIVMNTCYSFVSDKVAIHVASVHQYDAAKKVVAPLPGSGGVSAVRSEAEAVYANAWAKNIWADMLG
jgi:NADPH-dependent 2,4-dienoyl-CoA reductase/sulfur reductase-like enzyme